MKKITITNKIMTDRYVDKKIKVLELISKDFRNDCVSNVGSKIADDELKNIIEELEHYNLLRIQSVDLISIPNESPRNEIVVYYKIINREKIAELLKRMRAKYPRLKEPIIEERPLGKIAKLFSALDTKDAIIALLERCDVPKILIESQYIQTEIIFRILNHYAWSAKKEDYKILTKIIEEFVRPIMFDGNKKESKGIESMLNGLLEDDGFVIKDGNFQQVKNSSEKIKSTSIKTTLEKIPIKKIRLDETDHMIVINRGSKLLPFTSNTKQFRILKHLWESRWEIKNNDVLKEGDFVPVEILKRLCNCPTNGAIKKQIMRINKLFENHNINMEVDSKKNKYRLVIHMA